MSLGVVLPCAGSGTRVGADRPKQFLDLGGRPVFHHALAAFLGHRSVSSVALVVAPDELEGMRSMLDLSLEFSSARESGRVVVVAGGAERWMSVRNGVAALPVGCDLVVVHDVARPFVTESDIDALVEAALRDGAATFALPSPDTVKWSREGETLVDSTLDRRRIWLTQTPQAFRREVLEDCYFRLPDRRDLSPTDEAGLAEAFGHSVRLVPGAQRLHKITTADDLEWARWAASRAAPDA